MILKTTLLGKTYQFRDLKQVLAKANEEKTGDRLAGLAAEDARERIAAKVVLSAVTLQELRENPAVPYEDDEVTRIIRRYRTLLSRFMARSRSSRVGTPSRSVKASAAESSASRAAHRHRFSRRTTGPSFTEGIKWGWP